MRAAEHQHQRPCRVKPQGTLQLLGVQRLSSEHRGTQGHACHAERLSGCLKELGRLGISEPNSIDERGQQAGHQSGQGVLLMDHRRDPQRRGPEHGGEGGIAARPDHELWPEALDHPKRLKHAPHVLDESRSQLWRGAALEAPCANGEELDLGMLSQHAGLEAASGADVGDTNLGAVALTKRLNERPSRVEVAAGATSGQQDPQGQRSLLSLFVGSSDWSWESERRRARR